MTLIKRAYFPGERDGEPLVVEIRPGESVKTASALAPGVQKFIDGLKPDPKYTYTLCNAMGYSQFYGSNSNKDWYGYNPHLDFDGLLNAWPEIGEDLEADRMKGKDWPYGYPCFYGATVYAHHKNTDPQQLGFGDVIYAGINPVMKRVELVKRVFNEEATKKGHTSILSRIRAGERCDVSMGCKVPFDFCSVCTDWGLVKKAWKTFDPNKHRHPGVAILYYHKTVTPIRGLAITRSDYCPHMLTMGGKILPDGQKVYVYNDFPRFFDISFVWIGADRTARVMWHLSDGELPSVRTTSTDSGLLERLLRGILAKHQEKVSAMEKEIPDGVAQAVHADSDSMPELDEAIIRVVTKNPRRALSTLAALGIVLTPSEFQKLVLGDKLFGSSALEKVSFDTSISAVDDTYAVDPALYDERLGAVFEPLMSDRSGFAPFLNPRLLDTQKIASRADVPVISNAVMDKIAAQYNGYRLSVLEQAPALFPKVAGHLGTDLDLQEKISSPAALAGLLLGVGPMVHFLSSHLRRRREAGQQLGPMSNFVAENPTFTTVTTIGGLLRAAIEIGKAGGLIGAVKSVANVARKMIT